MDRSRLLCIALLFGLPQAVHAQQSVRIPDDLACACRLEPELVTTLRDDDGRAGLSSPLVVERTSAGQYLVVPSNRQGAVLLFDASGQFVRVVARPGQGPQEFGAVIGLQPGLADSMLAMDAGNGRLAVLDPGLRVARTMRIPRSSSWFGMTGDGSVVALTGIPRAGAASRDRIQIFAPDMSPVRSFMPSDPDGSIEAQRRRLSLSRSGVIAVGHNDRYLVEIWNASGQHLKTFIRDPDWFWAEASPPTASGGSGPAARLETPRVDEEGRIWTVSHVADARWQEALENVRDLYGRAVLGVPAGAQSKLLDSVVEVLDADAATLLGSVRIDPHVVLISNDGHAASYGEDELGLPYIEVWRFALVREPEEGGVISEARSRPGGER